MSVVILGNCWTSLRLSQHDYWLKAGSQGLYYTVIRYTQLHYLSFKAINIYFSSSYSVFEFVNRLHYSLSQLRQKIGWKLNIAEECILACYLVSLSVNLPDKSSKLACSIFNSYFILLLLYTSTMWKHDASESQGYFLGAMSPCTVSHILQRLARLLAFSGNKM